MSQQTVEPTAETKTVLEVSAERKGFPNIVPPPQMVIEIAETSKKRIGTFVDSFVATWDALPPQRKRIITLIGLSVLVSVTTSLIATLIARVIRATRTEETGE
jgi:hypothetical protein